MSTVTPRSSSPALDTFRDIILWRRKKLSTTLLLISTATWILLQVYQFNFITVASWSLIFILASFFIWGNILRLLGKEAPNMYELNISGQTTVDVANTCGRGVEDVLRWMFHVTVEENCFVFAKTVAALLFISYVATLFDFFTLLYIGIAMLLTVPVIYMNYGDQMKRNGERVKGEIGRFYEMLDEKVLRKMISKFVKQDKAKRDE